MAYAILAVAVVAAFACAVFVLTRARQAGIALQQQLAEIRQQASDIESALGVARDEHNRWAAKVDEASRDTAGQLATVSERLGATARMAQKNIVETLQIQRAVALPAPRSPALAESDAPRLTVPAARPGGPAVSIVLTVKNGMPHLPAAIDSVRAQDFRDFELVVQDCLSTDGTLEYLQGIADIPVVLESVQDSGIGDAWRRAVNRCSGRLLGSIDADNLLKPDALTKAVRVFERQPQTAALYSAIELIDEEGRLESCFVPRPFDILELIGGQLVPPWSTAFFSREVCGAALYFDPEIRVCADFDVWLRISHLNVVQIGDVLGATRISPASMTCRPASYDGFCAAKIQALQNYLRRRPAEPLVESLQRYGTASIYCWAAESVERLGAGTADVLRYADLALQADPLSDRAKAIRSRAADWELALGRNANDLEVK